MNINRSEVADMVSKLSITLEPSDYRQTFKDRLKGVKAKANLKGFRAGHVPDHVIMKMYGESVLAEILDKMFSEKIYAYLHENNVPYICQPLPAEGQQSISLNPADANASYTFEYEVGTRNELDINGISPEDVYETYTITGSEDVVEDRIKELEHAYGKMEIVDEAVEINDKVDVSAVELNEELTPKKDGWHSAFELDIFAIKEEEQAKFVGLKKGDKVVVNINEFSFRDADNVRKSLLQVDEDDDRAINDMFELTIEAVKRKMPIVLDDEKVKELFGQNDVDSMEKLREILSRNAQHEHDDKVRGKLFDDIYKRMYNETELTYSDTFVKRWLREYENMSADKVEEMYESFQKDFKWSIIQGEMQNRLGVQVTNSEVDQYLMSKADSFMQQFGFFDQGIFDKVLKRMKEDRNEVYKASNIILSNKIFSEIEKLIQKDTKEISLKAFEELRVEETAEVEAE